MNFLSTLLKPFTGLFGLLSASGFLFKLVKNYAVLKESFQAIENVFKTMQDEKRSLPDHNESIMLMQVSSNILKTGIIDIPGFDEYELSLSIDKYSEALSVSLKDARSEKYHQILITKKGK